jgi:hypothetical protein
MCVFSCCAGDVDLSPAFALAQANFCSVDCCRMPPGYVYPNPYLAAAPGMVSLQQNQISHLTAAAAAASNPFYTTEYQPAAFPGQYANGLDPYAYSSAAGNCHEFLYACLHFLLFSTEAQFEE